MNTVSEVKQTEQSVDSSALSAPQNQELNFSPRGQVAIPDRLGNLDVIHLNGTPTEIGTTHGRMLAAEIKECYNIYRSFWPSLTDQEISKFAQQQALIIKGAFRHYAEEMQAIADAAKVPYEVIIALNSRTELAHFNARRANEINNPQTLPHECTLIGDRTTGVLGENWDWSVKVLPLTKLLHITLPNGLELLTLTEPGIIGKVGMNSLGVGVGLNYIPGNKDGFAGVPVHLILRRCLEAQSYDEAMHMLYEMPYAKLSTMSAITVMDRFGGGGVFELRGEEVVRTSGFNDRILSHTNHVDVEKPEEWPNSDLANSVTRLKTACRMAQDRPITVDVLKEILADRSNDDYSINMRPKNWGEFGDVCSIRGIIMDLKNGDFYITKEAPGKVDGIPTYESVNLYGRV